MYCFKCMDHTGDTEISEIINAKNQKYLTTKCKICGVKKCKFIKRNPSGNGVEMGVFARYAKLAYEDPGDRGELEDKELSNDEAAVFVNNDTVIVAFRGTVLTNPRDLIADARIAYGNFLSGSRMKRSISFVNKVTKKYPDKEIILTGHSLGARIAHDVASILGLKSYSYNMGSSPVDIPFNLLETLRCKYGKNCNIDKEKQKAFHSYGDPVSLSSLSGYHDTEIVPRKPGHDVHTIDNFIMD